MGVILTSNRCKEKELLQQMREFGEFYRTEFRDVVTGSVEDLEVFLQELEKRNIFALSRVVPIEKSFIFFHTRIVMQVCETVRPLLEKILKRESFSVTVERRGFKGAFSSQEVAKEVGIFVSEFLQERDGEKPDVNLRNPDKAIVLEALRRRCGIGIIAREMMEKYFYFKLP
jgi:tRNA(Ser,Leu) C12 N-acetylase TAN1